MKLKILILFLGFVTSLFLVEIYLRVFYSNKINVSHSLYSDKFIAVNKPGIEFVYHGEDFHSRVKYNSLGFRGEEYKIEKPDNHFRIAVLGDSFTEALQVEGDETYVKQLEKKLNQLSNRKVNHEVLNFGVSAYGTDQELRLLQEVVVRYQPDVLILQLFKNDLADMKKNQLIEIDENGFRFKDNLYTGLPTKLAIPFKQILSRLYIAHFIGQKIWQSLEKPTDISNVIDNQWWTKEKKLLSTFKDLSQKYNFKLLMLIAVSGHQLRQGDFQPDLFNVRLTGVAKELDILLIDPLALFAQEEQQGNKVHFRSDGHWNNYGHQLLAGAIIQELIKEHLISLP